jgi:anti-sigma regulatory factor (Ser/Thr protein kinase)
MDEMLEVTLAGGRAAPGLARRALAAMNGSLAELRYPVSLLVSELVTNSVEHAGAGEDRNVCVKLDAASAHVRVEVIDEGPGFEGRRERQIDPIEDGFGLALVDQLSDRWGVEVNDETRVWFEIDRKSV